MYLLNPKPDASMPEPGSRGSKTPKRVVLYFRLPYSELQLVRHSYKRTLNGDPHLESYLKDGLNAPAFPAAFCVRPSTRTWTSMHKRIQCSDAGLLVYGCIRFCVAFERVWCVVLRKHDRLGCVLYYSCFACSVSSYRRHFS